MKNFIICICIACIAFALQFCFMQTAYAEAPNITGKCAITASSNQSTVKKAIDGKYKTVWSAKKGAGYMDITIPAAKTAGGLYIRWDKAPQSWTLTAAKGANAANSGAEVYLTQYIPIPDSQKNCKKFRLSFKAPAGAGIAELTVYSAGKPPYYAPQWQPYAGTADLMAITAHPDDEDLYVGTEIPLAINGGKTCVNVVMTYGPNAKSVRRFEAQESIWSLGVKTYPVMRDAIDKKTLTKELAMQYWPLDKTIGFLVEQIRKYKPSVIVTHDVRGEYGHGAHKLTEYTAELAFLYAADPAQYPESAMKYGTWAAAKFYSHLYWYNPLTPLDLNTKLKLYGNRTLLKVIADAYARHKSQLPGRVLPVNGPYDMRKYGLYSTRVGFDKTHASMFEHVSRAAMLQLNPWYNAYAVNLDALNAALSAAHALNASVYTSTSWAKADIADVSEDGEAVLADRTATQETLDNAAKAINKAITLLKRK